MVIVDDYSCFPWVYFMKWKSEVLQTYQQWKKDVQTFFWVEIGEEHFSELYVDFLHSDNGGEYTGENFWSQLQSDGTLHETSAADTPEQNGTAERMNQTLATLTNTMLEESKLPKSFWADAMDTAAYITGRSPASTISRKTPYEQLFNRNVDPTLFCPFGCPTYAWIPKDKHGGKF